MIKEIPINTLDSSELLLQFRVMQALGYRSLWEADFQREMRNPLRRQIYYRLITMQDSQNKLFQMELLKNIANRISFFSDPELFKKVKDSEEQHSLDTMTEEARQAMESKYDKEIRKHPQMTESDLAKIRKILEN
jgi:hypothetical protein